MTQPYRMHTDKPWSETRRELAEQFRMWRVSDHEVLCSGAGSERQQQAPADRRVTVRWTTPGGQPMTLTMDRHPRAVDNFRVLYLAVEAMRLNEVRGISDVLREAYLQLPAAPVHRDPYEVLGVRPDTPLEDIEAMFRIKSKRAHPDAGGSDKAMAELSQAIGAIRAERQ